LGSIFMVMESFSLNRVTLWERISLVGQDDRLRISNNYPKRLNALFLDCQSQTCLRKLPRTYWFQNYCEHWELVLCWLRDSQHSFRHLVLSLLNFSW
jgi:hypothetical protein